MKQLIILCFLPILIGCGNTIEKKYEAPTHLLTLHNLKTTARSTDNKAHLLLHADSACRDHQAQTITATQVDATFTHNGTPVMTVATAHAQWHEVTHELTNRDALTCQHTHGILCAKGGVQLRLHARRLDLCGPITHTIAY